MRIGLGKNTFDSLGEKAFAVVERNEDGNQSLDCMHNSVRWLFDCHDSDGHVKIRVVEFEFLSRELFLNGSVQKSGGRQYAPIALDLHVCSTEHLSKYKLCRAPREAPVIFSFNFNGASAQDRTGA